MNLEEDVIDFSSIRMKTKIKTRSRVIELDENACDYLEAIVCIRTGEIRYRCEWCETGAIRTCNYRSKLEECMFDKYGNEKETKT